MSEFYPYTYTEYRFTGLHCETVEHTVSARPANLVTPLVAKSQSTYRAALRAPIRGLWNGALNFYQFADSMRLSIERHLTQAWNEGAKLCGIAADELTQNELIILDDIIVGEWLHIQGLGDDISASTREKGGKLTPLYQRAELWVNRWPDVRNRAKLIACADQKLMWKINQTRIVKENCPTCLRLNGKVKRASYWRESGIQPQNPPNPYLICGGWQCGCDLVPTDAPLSRGRLPR